MKTFDWKDKYMSAEGTDVTAKAKYMSVLGSQKGDGSRHNPYPATIDASKSENDFFAYVLGCGSFVLEKATGVNKGVVTGQSYTDSVLARLETSLGGGGTYYLSNLRLDSTFYVGGADYIQATCYNVLFNNTQYSAGIRFYVNLNNSIFKDTFIAPTGTASAKFCSYYNCVDNGTILNGLNPLLSACEVFVDSAFLSNFNSRYTAFDNCRFRIGNEDSASKLVGSDAAALRANFAARCTAQGLNVPNITEFDQTAAVGRWVFSNSSLTGHYYVISDSEIDQFAHRRALYFGHANKTVTNIPIVMSPNIKNSISPANSKSNTVITDESISLDVPTITARYTAYADSKVIWLGGKSKLTDLNITHNLPTSSGVALDSVYAFAPAIANDSLELGVSYIVKSSDNNFASVKYNGVEYSTSLIDRKNVIKAVAGSSSFEVLSGNPVLYPVVDAVNYSNVQLRIVNELPGTAITSGNLIQNYWYIVVPNDLADQSGSITYKGVKYGCLDSFVTDGTLSFSVSGTCHLRRCWHKDFDFDTESTDKAFWADKQKPKLIDILPYDLRCLHKDNSSSANEMQADSEGNYIASAHIDFYTGVNGVGGMRLPAFELVGSFMQIRIPISTLNPM